MENTELVAACGLYCGACGSYLKKKCPGCKGNEKATWCAVRSCCRQKSIPSCAGCGEFSSLYDCKKLNNIFSKVIGFFTHSDRIKSVGKLKELGCEAYAAYMDENKLQSLKKS